MEDNKINANGVLRLMWSNSYNLTRPSSVIIPELIVVINELVRRIEILEDKNKAESEARYG